MERKPELNFRAIRRSFYVLGALAAWLSTSILADPAPRSITAYAEQFDCADAFDLTALATTVRCPATGGDARSATEFEAATSRLVDAGFFTAADFDGVRLDWCPLTQAMGFTASATRIYIDDGLRDGSTDLLAEVVAHEMIHVEQFRRLGQRGFKCAYVNAFLACGACQDRGHELEGEAYRFQDTVRERFLERFLQTGD